jgi:hypothetical protein
MPAWPRRFRGTELRDQAVDPQIRAQRLAAVKASDGVKQAALGQPALNGIDWSVANGRRVRQPSLGGG